MKLRLLLLAATLCLSIAISAGPGFAQAEEIKLAPELVRQMLQDGWTKVAEGVLQRSEPGPVETFTYGEDGLRWTARKLEARIKRFEKEFESYPTAELGGILQSLKSQLLEMEEVLASGVAGAEAVSSDELAECSTSPDILATAVAGPETGPSAQGVKAYAKASFRSSCGETANTYALAYARATGGGGMTNDPKENSKYNSSSAESEVSASAPGSLDCFSEAYALVWNSDYTLDEDAPAPNYSCPPPPPPTVTASISGPATVSRNGCVAVTWYASATGGSGAYSYKWYLGTGTVIVSARSSFSRMYCQPNQVNLRVVATDTSSPAQTDEATFTTSIN